MHIDFTALADDIVTRVLAGIGKPTTTPDPGPTPTPTPAPTPTTTG